MKKFYDLIVVIPVGPGTNIGFIEDTLMSFIRYTRSNYKIIIMDDSHEGAGAELQTRFPQLDVHYTSRSLGTMCGLYINLSVTYKWILERYRFRSLFKLDTDALIIGSGPEEMALSLFSNDPMMGIAGQYPSDYHGQPWDIGWPRDRILNGATTWKFVKRPRANWILRKLYRQAVENGYKAGESVFGGAYFMSESLLMNLSACGLLPHYKLKSLNLGEDHLFALLAKSLGFGLGSLSEGDMPFGCAWKGLPVSPEELWKGKKKVIHSTRHWEGMEEEEIRAFFRRKRAEDQQTGEDPVEPKINTSFQNKVVHG